MSAAVAVAGEFTIFTAREIHASFLSAIGGEAKEIEIDLSGVTEIDSAGLQLMLAAQREAAARGLVLRFSACSQAVADLLELCGLAGFFAAPPALQEQGSQP